MYYCINERPMTRAVLLKTIKDIPEETAFLFIAQNNLTDAELAAGIQILPDSVIALTLRLNDLKMSNVASLNQVLKSMPANIAFLSLGMIVFDKLSAAEWVQVLQTLPPHLNALDLSSWGLGHRSVAEVMQILEALASTGVTFLDLHGNSLSRFSAADLIQVFQAISPKVTSLELSLNSFDAFSVSDLVKIVQALPKGVIELDLSLNGLEHLSTEDLTQVLINSPSHVKSVIFDNKTIHLDEFRERVKNQLLKNLEPQLIIIKRKVDELHQRDYKIADTFHSQLRELIREYKVGSIDYPDFKDRSLRVIHGSRKELSQHRGWKDVMGNAALFILGIGIFYMAACMYRGSFFACNFNTDSIKKVNDLERGLNPVIKV